MSPLSPRKQGGNRRAALHADACTPWPLNRRARALAAALCIGFTSLPALAQPLPLADPRVAWSTADTAHFRVHYRSAQRAQAEAVAQAAERVWPQVTQGLDWQVRGRTELVVYNEFDRANGFTTPLPFNMIGVFLAPPDESELLDNSNWLDLLLVHEFTHAVHLDKVLGAPAVGQSIFGNVPWFIPNLFQPRWMLEGLAVYNESKPDSGHGRLKAPLFEAWLRAERKKGFISLRELNADGRNLPSNKQYLYGAYFYEYLARTYGADKPAMLVDYMSANNVFTPRLYSAPLGATGKTMDALWEGFIADLTQQVDARAQPIVAQPEVGGNPVAGPLLDVNSVAALPGSAGGGWLAVVGDGLHGMQLTRISSTGERERVVRVLRGARVDVAADGTVLVTQPDTCNKYYLAYDVYRLEGSRLRQLSRCAHLRRATQVAGQVLALQLVAGRTRLVQLAEGDGELRVLWEPSDGTELLDLAGAPEGKHLRLLTHRGADWRVVELDLNQPGTAPKTLVRQDRPIRNLRQGAAGLELIATAGGAPNVWRLQGAQLQRLTNSHTAVMAHAGTAGDGSLLNVTLDPQGVLVRRLVQPAVLQSVPAIVEALEAAAVPASPAETANPAGSGLTVLGEGRDYAALRSVYPRYWLPAIAFDRGLSAFGASTSGSDALGCHRYAALAQWETSQKELIGAFEYQFAGSHGVAVQRQLAVQAWTGSAGKETTTVYDRTTKAQWLSLIPFSRIDRHVVLGVGAAAEWNDRVNLVNGTTTRRLDERLVAGLLDLDFSASDRYAEGPYRGFRFTGLVESYKPLVGGDPLRYDGTVARADLSGFVPVGRSVLAARYTEARARSRTEPFQLGGATDILLQLGPTLNVRNLSLRGYGGDEQALRGQNARVASVEWRTPLADIDRHFMLPAVGINRLSAAAFFDVGGAWNTGSGPDQWRRSVGFELLGEVRLLYSVGVQLRLGVAKGLDEPKGTRAYLSTGRSF